MPTRLLSDEQRRRYGRYAGEPTEKQLDRYFHLDEVDRDLVARLRGDHNRLGFAVQLGTVRFLGTFLDDPTDVPRLVLTTLAKQLALDELPTLDGYRDGRQRWRHQALIREGYGYSDFTADGGARFRLTRWLYALCWAGDDRPSLLIDRATSWLVANKLLLPGISAIERLVAQVRHRTSRRAWRILAASLEGEQRRRLQALLDPAGDDVSVTLERLRAGPTRRTPGELLRSLARLEAIRAQGIRPIVPKHVPSALIQRLARFGLRARPSALVRLPEPRRTAMLVALFHVLEAVAQDDAIELFEALATEIFGGAAKDHQQARARTTRDIDRAAPQLGRAWHLLLRDEVPDQGWRELVFARFPKADLKAAADRIEALVRPDDDCHYEELRRRWRRTRRLFSELLRHVAFSTAPGAQPIKQALDHLRSLEGWDAPSMVEAPRKAVSRRWRRHVFDARGRIDNRAYVFAVLEGFREALKRREIFAVPSIRFADPRHGLLAGAAWEASRVTVCRTLGRSADAGIELEALEERLDRAYRRVVANLPDNPAVRLERRNGRSEIVLTALDRLEEPESLKRLKAMVGERLPKVDLPDVLLEVAACTGFTDAFRHVSEKDARVDGLTTSLCAVLVAEACNIGFEPLIRTDDPALSRARLSWVAQSFVRDETIAAANARLVAAQNALPVVRRCWGTGEVASADGVRFTVPSQTIHAGPNPKYFGLGRGITYYNLMSDQFTGLNAVVVPGTLRDSLIILGLLLEQETELEPAEIMTDTGAYTDCIFGLFWLLGYQFSPRLADIGGARFWRIDAQADYGPLNAIARHRVDTRRIAWHWDDLLRLAGSLKLGHVHPNAVMRMLQVKDQPTALAKALSDLGRIIKTLHLLGYVDDEGKRRGVLTQLNRHEYRHRLARVVCHGKRGEIRKPRRQDQEEQLGALGLVLNVIVLWNAIYIGAAIEQIQAEGLPVDPRDIARLSPLGHRHINFLGRYAFVLPEPIAKGQLRPLREPSSVQNFRGTL